MGKRAQESKEEPPKKSKKELQMEAAEATKKAEEQRLMSATCLKSTATDAQKAMYATYKAAPRFSDLKAQLLQKFVKDKKCGWFQSCEQVKSESHNSSNAGLRGYGTRHFLQRVVV